jgi:hypothetical protein
LTVSYALPIIGNGYMGIMKGSSNDGPFIRRKKKSVPGTKKDPSD